MEEEKHSAVHSDGEGDLRRRLSRAMLHFQDRLLEGNISPGSLCQVWMPEVSEEGDQVLKAKGQPYCAAGVVDLLALFRCISCRYCFSTDLTKPELLGAPGRVFTSRQPEMTRNVQQQSKAVYLRAQEALHCRVHSTLVLPLYRHPDRGQVAGVLEVIQTSEDMVFSQLVDILSQVLEQCSLYTVDQLQLDRMRKTQPEAMAVSVATSKADNSVHMSASQNSSHGSPKSILNMRHSRDSASPEGVDETSGQLPIMHPLEAGDHSVHGGNRQTRTALYAHLAQQQQQQQLIAAGVQHEHGGAVRGSNAAAAALQLAQVPQGMVTRHTAVQNKLTDGLGTRDSSLTGISFPEDSKISSCYDDEEIGSDDGDGWEDDMEDSAEGAGSDDINGRLANRRRGKGTGNPGKPGKKLRLADLQSQFGVGLKEAANKLGICPTTLKRACRRHGIQRWPRRQLARLTRAIDQIRSSGDTAPPIPGESDRPLRSSSRGRAASEGGALVQSPQSAPTSSGGQAFSEPGPDTRWSALDQLIPTFSNPLDEASVHGPGKVSAMGTAAAPQAHEGSLSPALIHQPSSSPREATLELSPPMLHPESAEASATDLGLHMGLSSIAAADPWATIHLKDDPWAEAHAHKLGLASLTAEAGSSMQLDGESCGASLGEHVLGAEEDTVHGGSHAFHRAMSLKPYCPALPTPQSGLGSMAATDNVFVQGGLSIPSLSRESAEHRMAASHSPHLGDGLLSQSLETSVPIFGHGRVPQSLPNMMANSTLFRQQLGMQERGFAGLEHSQSIGHFSSDIMAQSQHAQREQQFVPHDMLTARTLSAHLYPNSPSAFETAAQEDNTRFGEPATPLPHFGDDMGHDMGLMDGDMLEMLLKPE